MNLRDGVVRKIHDALAKFIDDPEPYVITCGDETTETSRRSDVFVLQRNG